MAVFIPGLVATVERKLISARFGIYTPENERIRPLKRDFLNRK